MTGVADSTNGPSGLRLVLRLLVVLVLGGLGAASLYRYFNLRMMGEVGAEDGVLAAVGGLMLAAAVVVLARLLREPS